MTLKETYTGIDNGILEKIIGNEVNKHEADSIIQKRKVFKF